MNIHNDQVVINTKVSAEAFARIQSICKRKGFTMYNLLQMFADVLIRYMDDEHNLSADLQRVVRMFEGMNDLKDATNLADLKDAEVVEAVYILRKPNKKGERMVMVKPLFGNPQATYNIQDIFGRVLQVTNPSLYNHILTLSADMETESALDTVGRLADLYKENPDEQELRVMFEDNDWSEHARKQHEQPYKRKVTISMEDFEAMSYEQGR